MSAVAYVRVSTGHQADSGLGEEAQRAAIAAAAAREGLPPPTVFADLGVPSETPLRDRPGGADLCHAVDGGARAVILPRLDRAFRDLPEALTTCRRWLNRGADVVLCDLGVTLRAAGTPVQRAVAEAMLAVLGAAAAIEKAMIRERTKAASAAARALGRAVGQRPAFGWSWSCACAPRPEEWRHAQGRCRACGEAILVREDPAQQETLAQLLAWRAEGRSYDWIAAKLNETPGAGWYKATVRRLVLRAQSAEDAADRAGA